MDDMQLENIHGYQFNKSDFVTSPNGAWVKAISGGKEYFLKKFQNPKYPREGCKPQTFAEKKKECDEWLASKKKVIKALGELGNGTGNIISPRDIFKEKLCFYQATYWINVKADSLETIKGYSIDNKIMILKTYATALGKVHSKNIIHGDLKPENILIGQSGSGKPTAKLIDFDDSYFSKEALPPDLTVVTDAYQSPELAAYKRGNLEYREKLTCASDVFASGIIFHQYWCGKMPDYPGKEDGKFVYEAVASGQKCLLDRSIPDWLKNLIYAMLSPFPEDRPTMDEVHKSLVEQSFENGVATKGDVISTQASVDYSKLDKVIACIPIDLSAYSDDSVIQFKNVYNKIKAKRGNANQETIDKLAKFLYSAINNLEKKPLISKSVDYSRIEKILANIPKDLSDYTMESVTKLRKTIRFVELNKNTSSQDAIDRMAKLLFVAYKGLILNEANSDSFSIIPVTVLPSGYTKVKILSENKVCAFLESGSKITIPRTSAISMGLVVEKSKC